MMSQFSVMDNEMLACVEGGDIDWEEKLVVQQGLHMAQLMGV
ncbi:bacteriocin [Streptococcus pneumoniae B1598]|nr:bacteriocin [Streptococcus pneumoniae B1598]